MEFQKKLKNYADILICHGLNVQEGQDVYIAGEPIHRSFISLLSERAYERGARYVHTDLQDPMQTRLRILHAQTEESLDFVPAFVEKKYNDMIPATAANLRILGSEDPDLLADLDPKKVNRLQLAGRKKLRYFMEEGIGHSKVQWSLGAASTPKWGKKVFPELGEEEAEAALWEEIFRICRADRPDCLQVWKEHNRVLTERAKRLTDLRIRRLHFSGPGTDLKVGLSEKALFKGGCSKSPRGVEFEPNIPTEECFTTPDWRVTEGAVQTTRPFLINGKLVRGLSLTFHRGEIASFSASEGEEHFKEYIESDPGAKRLGEVALVDLSSPVYQSGRIFEEILFDENAACHIAVGFAYRFCIRGSEAMSPEELEAIGCNTSHVHTDMMISSEEVDVKAECYSGEEVPLIIKGRWI